MSANRRKSEPAVLESILQLGLHGGVSTVGINRATTLSVSERGPRHLRERDTQRETEKSVKNIEGKT